MDNGGGETDYFKWAIWLGVPISILQVYLIDELGVEGGLGELAGAYLCWSLPAIYLWISFHGLIGALYLSSEQKKRFNENVHTYAGLLALIPAFIFYEVLYG